jgi:hypothetical protein
MRHRLIEIGLPPGTSAAVTQVQCQATFWGHGALSRAERIESAQLTLWDSEKREDVRKRDNGYGTEKIIGRR